MSLLSEVVGAPVKSKGGYDASSNIIPPDGNPGDMYQITVAGIISGLSFDADDFLLILNDGSAAKIVGTSGGGGLANIVEDLTPQLGSTLDTQGNFIITEKPVGVAEVPLLAMFAGESTDTVGGGGGGVVGVVGGGGVADNNGGDAILQGGEVTDGTGRGGGTQVLGGDGLLKGGLVILEGGKGDNSGGDVFIRGGNSNLDGGSIELKAGRGSLAGGIGGDITLLAQGGDAGGGALSLSTSRQDGDNAGDIKLQSGDGGQIILKAGNDGLTGTPSSVRIYAPSGELTGAELELWKFTDVLHTTGFKIGLKAPDALAADVTFVLPATDGNADQALVTDGSQNLSFGSFSKKETGQNTQTGTAYTAVLADSDEMIKMNNAAANTVTIPANASVAYPEGTKLNFMQLGAGQTTITITTDTLNVEATLTLKLTGQYAVATALKISATVWVLFGNLEAV